MKNLQKETNRAGDSDKGARGKHRHPLTRSFGGGGVKTVCTMHCNRYHATSGVPGYELGIHRVLPMVGKGSTNLYHVSFSRVGFS